MISAISDISSERHYTTAITISNQNAHGVATICKMATLIQEANLSCGLSKPDLRKDCSDTTERIYELIHFLNHRFMRGTNRSMRQVVYIKGKVVVGRLWVRIHYEVCSSALLRVLKSQHDVQAFNWIYHWKLLGSFRGSVCGWNVTDFNTSALGFGLIV
jgi:hypothetical protein